MNHLNHTTLALLASLTACGVEPTSAPERLGMCVAIGAGDAPVFRPCDQIDFEAETCTFRVLDTTQIRALNQTMTEEQCLKPPAQLSFDA